MFSHRTLLSRNDEHFIIRAKKVPIWNPLDSQIMLTAILATAALGYVSTYNLPADKLVINSSSAILMDADSGAVLWEKDSETQRPPASTTKILTAILLIENCEPGDMVTVTKEAAKTPESSIHLKEGEKVSVRQLLHAIMMRSANDACVAGAIHLSGSVPKFVELMNKRAKEVGCTNTNFENPNGLPNDKHLTTAKDLALLGKQAMRYPLMREIVAKQKTTIERSINKADSIVVNRNKLLAKDQTINGIKTGWTRAAGNCFVGSASRNGMNLISVVMNSQDWQADTLLLMDWGSGNGKLVDLALRGEVFVETTVKDGGAKLMASTNDALKRVMMPDTIVEKEVKLTPDLVAPIQQGAKIGTITFRDQNGWEKTLPLYAKAAVPKQDRSYTTGAGLVIGLGLIGAYSLTRYRRNTFYGRLNFPNSSS